MKNKAGAIVSGLVLAACLHGQVAPQLSKAEFTRRLVVAAVERSKVHVRYVPEYVRIAYPGGDVPADTGVCTDDIDHRRVPNLIVFFERNGESLPKSQAAGDYSPGDIVTWDLGNGLTHIGMVVDRKPLLHDRFEVLHNIGQGPQIECVV